MFRTPCIFFPFDPACKYSIIYENGRLRRKRSEAPFFSRIYVNLLKFLSIKYCIVANAELRGFQRTAEKG